MVEVTEEKANSIKSKMHYANFYKFLGMQVIDIKECYARVRIPFKEELLQAEGMIHGGVLASICDSAVGIALLSQLDPEDIIVTIELNVNYVAPVRSGDIVAEARIVHRGRRTALGDVEVLNEGKLVCKSSATFMIIKKEDEAYREETPSYISKKYRCDF